MTPHELAGPPPDSRTLIPGEPEHSSEQAPFLRGRFLLEREIEDEPLAKTYMARDVTLDRILAITVLQEHLADKPTLGDRFLEAERQAAALFHPNLVTIFDVGATDGLCWSAHEYCGGGQLRQRLPTRQAIPSWQVVSLLGQVGSAVQALHVRGIVHGRISPNSIRFDDAGSAKLDGIGVAAVADLQQSSVAAAEFDLGAYLAPEQRERDLTSQPTDQYALALIGAELLVGRWHTPGLGSPDQCADDLLAYLRQARPDIPVSMHTALSRALNVDPERRFISVGDFLLALNESSTDALGHKTMPPQSTEGGSPFRHDTVRRPERSVTRRLQVSSVAPIRHGVPLADQRLRGMATATLAWARAQSSALGRQAVSASRASHRHLDAAMRNARTHLSQHHPPHPRSAVAWYRRQHPADRVLLLAGAVALILSIALIVPMLLNPPATLATPVFEGASADTARTLAAQSGFQLKLRDESSPTVPAGQVMWQDPPPGALLRSDRPVQLLVSNGPPPVPVPNILRRDVESARQELASKGLVIGTVNEYDTNRQDWGTITAQSVRTGREVAPGTPIDITIATPPWTSVPRLLDRGIGDVERDLADRGLKLGEVNVQPQADVRAGTVLRQEPPPDTKIRQGERVAAVIALPAAPKQASE